MFGFDHSVKKIPKKTVYSFTRARCKRFYTLHFILGYRVLIAVTIMIVHACKVLLSVAPPYV